MNDEGIISIVSLKGKCFLFKLALEPANAVNPNLCPTHGPVPKRGFTITGQSKGQNRPNGRSFGFKILKQPHFHFEIDLVFEPLNRHDNGRIRKKHVKTKRSRNLQLSGNQMKVTIQNKPQRRPPPPRRRKRQFKEPKE